MTRKTKFSNLKKSPQLTLKRQNSNENLTAILFQNCPQKQFSNVSFDWKIIQRLRSGTGSYRLFQKSSDKFICINCKKTLLENKLLFDLPGQRFIIQKALKLDSYAVHLPKNVSANSHVGRKPQNSSKVKIFFNVLAQILVKCSSCFLGLKSVNIQQRLNSVSSRLFRKDICCCLEIYLKLPPNVSKMSKCSDF